MAGYRLDDRVYHDNPADPRAGQHNQVQAPSGTGAASRYQSKMEVEHTNANAVAARAEMQREALRHYRRSLRSSRRADLEGRHGHTWQDAAMEAHFAERRSRQIGEQNAPIVWYPYDDVWVSPSRQDHDSTQRHTFQDVSGVVRAGGVSELPRPVHDKGEDRKHQASLSSRAKGEYKQPRTPEDGTSTAPRVQASNSATQLSAIPGSASAQQSSRPASSIFDTFSMFDGPYGHTLLEAARAARREYRLRMTPFKWQISWRKQRPKAHL